MEHTSPIKPSRTLHCFIISTNLSPNSDIFLSLQPPTSKSPASPISYNHEFYPKTYFFMSTATTLTQGTTTSCLVLPTTSSFQTIIHSLHSSKGKLKMQVGAWPSSTSKSFNHDQLYLELNLNSLLWL